MATNSFPSNKTMSNQRRASSPPSSVRRGGHGFAVAMTLSSLLLLVLVLLSPRLATATVVLPEYNRSFTSMPASFGGRISADDPPVMAHMMVMVDAPLLCKEEIDAYERHHNTTAATGLDVLPPDDGRPVALLVQRGLCTFHEKAKMASKWEAVKYVVVYDNEMSEELVPMSSEEETNMTLLFVSYVSGHELRDLIMRKMMSGDINDPVTSGILVELDGVAPVMVQLAPELNWAAYVLAAMSGFLAFLIFFGCLLMCAQLGCIVAQPDEHGRIVLFAGGHGARNLALRTIRSNLLTHDQVGALDEEEIQRAEGEGEEACCCAICLEEFEDQEKVRVLPCKHRFHGDCLVPWLTERHSSCPLCKFDVMQHVLDSQTDDDGQCKQNLPAGTEERPNNLPAQMFQDENPASAPVSLWNHLWGFQGWTGTVTEDHEHRILDSVSSEDDEEGQPSINTQGSTIREIEMERRTSAGVSVAVGDGSESTLVP